MLSAERRVMFAFGTMELSETNYSKENMKEIMMKTGELRE